MIEIIKKPVEAEYFYKSDFTGEIIDVEKDGLVVLPLNFYSSKSFYANVSLNLHLTVNDALEFFSLFKHKLSPECAENINRQIDDIISYGSAEQEKLKNIDQLVGSASTIAKLKFLRV